jgi:chaperonin GroES
MKIQATNNFVWVIRDETPDTVSGIILPEDAKVKPHTGTIYSAGNKVEDDDIRNGEGKKCVWHKTVGMEIEFNEQTYLVLLGSEIIGVYDPNE